jgi:hypothetical protein
MALSEHEQRLLEEMERNLRDDPKFASRVREVGTTNQSSGKLVAGVLLLLAGIAMLVLSVILKVAFFGVAAFLVMVIGLVVASQNFSLPKLPEMGGQARGNYYEDRWNQRFNNE